MKQKQKKHKYMFSNGDIFAGGLLALTLVSGAMLVSVGTYADGNAAVDTVRIVVPTACTMTGTGGDSHFASINPGVYSASSTEYANGIGKTTLKTVCNDNGGFSIYAIGYTGDVEGTNTLVGANTGEVIETKVYESGDRMSNWAMKVNKVDDATVSYNPLNMSVMNGFDNYHAVPDDYTQVVEYKSTTGSAVTDATLGAKVETTYAFYASTTQAADSYTGKVKYVMVHPNDAPAPVIGSLVNVNYDGNGEDFAGGVSSNLVTYAAGSMYVAETPEIAKSSNVAADGTKESGYTTGANVLTPISVEGAAKMKVVVNYGLSEDTEFVVAEGVWDGVNEPDEYEMIFGENATGTVTYTFEGNAVTLSMRAADAPAAGYDYGFYAQVYPVYATRQEGAVPSDEYATVSVSVGAYTTPSNWHGSWYAEIGGEYYDFASEDAVKEFLSNRGAEFDGETITLMRGLTLAEAYARAGKSQTGGYYVQQDLNAAMCRTLAVEVPGTLLDSRDGGTYAVAKLRDGNCWMLDNLALNLADSGVLTNVTEFNTNAGATALGYLKNGGGTSGDQYATSAVSEWEDDAAYAQGGSYSDPLVATRGGCDGSSSCADNPTAGRWTMGSLPPEVGGSSHFGAGSGRIGVYYNYCAVSAGSYCYGDGGSSSGSASGDLVEDICPKNWKLPRDEYEGLLAKYDAGVSAASTDSLQYGLSVSLSGYYDSGLAYAQGTDGLYWAAGYGGGGNMGNFGVSSMGAYMNANARDNGFSVRCVVGE